MPSPSAIANAGAPRPCLCMPGRFAGSGRVIGARMHGPHRDRILGWVGMTHRVRSSICAVVALSGCAHVAVFAQPDAIARHAGELATRGHARIEVEQGGTVSVSVDDPIVVTIPGNERSYAWGLIEVGVPDQTEKLSVGNFVAGCGPDGSGACMASRVHDSIRVGTQRQLDPGGLAIGLFGALATAVGTVCLTTTCTGGNRLAYVGTGIGVATLLVPLSTVF